MVRRQRIALAALTIAWAGLLLACGGTGTSSSKTEQPAKPAAPAADRRPSAADPTQSPAVAEKKEPTPSPPAEKKWPYQFVESKTEQTRHRDVMDLYAFDGEFDPADLKAFCKERKDKSPAKVFYYVVIFDKAANAKFPSTPFTAQYDGDEEGALKQKHIRAIYCYNKLNGFSELSYHPQNVWEHIPTREKI